MKGKWPRLSETLKGPRSPARCQACGAGPDAGLQRWREHDDRDRPERVVVVLCRPCVGKLVGPHPRLYERLADATPWPGCMGLCLACAHREGVECRHPLNLPGGPGVEIVIEPPSHAHVSYTEGGRRKGRWETIHRRKATACKQREAKGGEAPADPAGDARGAAGGNP